jgi:hypothetical protein
VESFAARIVAGIEVEVEVGGAGVRLQALYGLSPDLSDVIPAKGVSTSYQASDMCGLPANISAQALYRNPGVIHTVNMTSLKPNTRYYYQFGNDIEGWSDVHSFVSRPQQVGSASWGA